MNVPCPNCGYEFPVDVRWCSKCKSYRPKWLKTWKERKRHARSIWSDFIGGIEGFKKSHYPTIIFFSAAIVVLLCLVFAAFQAKSLGGWVFLSVSMFLTAVISLGVVGLGLPVSYFSWLLFSVIVVGRDPYEEKIKDGSLGFNGFMTLVFWMILGASAYGLSYYIPIVGPYVHHHLLNEEE